MEAIANFFKGSNNTRKNNKINAGVMIATSSGNNTRKNNGALVNSVNNVAPSSQAGGRRHRKGSRKAHRKSKKPTRRVRHTRRR
jgi:hypothetical protein